MIPDDEYVPYVTYRPRTRLARAWWWLSGTAMLWWDWAVEPRCRPWRRR